jgi:hypothetical protein
MVNLLYPRTVSHRRSALVVPSSAVGLGGYEGREATPSPPNPNGEVMLHPSIQCGIESRGIGRSTGHTLLPGQVSTHPQWRIITPPMPIKTIRDNDILVDDEGYRYQVALNFWTPFGYVLDCIRLET